MRSHAFTAGLVAALLVAGQALAATWTLIANDGDKVSFEFDASSVKPAGGYVTSWARMTWGRPKWDASRGKFIKSVLLQRLDNCTTRLLAVSSTLSFDASGHTVGSTVVPRDHLQFETPAPGSIQETAQNQICSIAARRAALKPALGPTTPTSGDWRPVAYDPVLKVDHAIDMKTIVPLKQGGIAYIDRASGSQKLADGTEYAAAYWLVLLDCDKGAFANTAGDYYDDGGNLVSTATIETASLNWQTAPKGSIVAMERDVACAAAKAARDRQDAPSEPETGLFSGTAWLGPKGYLITANHVVEGASGFRLALNGAPVGTAEVVVTDPANDVAILRPKFIDGAHAALALGEAPASLGEKVFTLGYPAPDRMGLSIKMTSGEVSALAGADEERLDDARLLQVSIPIQSGNSGGPVIDRSGRVVAIVISKLTMTSKREVAQNVNYALKIGYVRNLLAELPDVGGYRAVKASTSLTGLVSDVQGSVFLIVGEKDKEE